MFDDFMHNDFTEMHINQAHQDAMLHAQNQAMNQAMGTQGGATRDMPIPNPQAPEPVPPTGIVNAAMSLRMLIQVAVEKMSGRKKL